MTPGYNFSGDCASYAACIETFYGAIQSAPIVQGATAIEEAWPAGTCDIGSVSLATFGGQSFNFGTQACLVWTNYIEVPLSAILLVVYAVAGFSSFLVLEVSNGISLAVVGERLDAAGDVPAGVAASSLHGPDVGSGSGSELDTGTAVFSNIAGWIGSIPSLAAFLLSALQIGTLVTILVAAYTLRFLIRRIFFLN